MASPGAEPRTLKLPVGRATHSASLRVLFFSLYIEKQEIDGGFVTIFSYSRSGPKYEVHIVCKHTTCG